MTWAVTVEKPGTVVVIRRNPHRSDQVYVCANTQHVALVVIQIKKSFLRGREVSEAPGHRSLPFHRLVRIGEVHGTVSGNAGRTQRDLLSANTYPIDGERQEDVGVLQGVVIEIVARAGTEVGGVGGPAT